MQRVQWGYKRSIEDTEDPLAIHRIQRIHWRYTGYRGSIGDTQDTEDPLAIRGYRQSRDPLFPPWKYSSSFSLSFAINLVPVEHLQRKRIHFKWSSNKLCPTIIDYCWLLCVQFHYNSICKGESFYGYTVDDACNFDAIRASKADFIR
jgi:hypothetical protein